MIRVSAVILGIACAMNPVFAPAAEPTPIELIRAGLEGTGIEGEIHAVRAEDSVFVFTWRNPNDFFDFQHCSMIPGSPAVAAELAKLKRHDRVRLKGLLADNKSPQPHLEIRSVEMVKAYDPSRPLPDYNYEVKLPDDLPRNSFGDGEATFLVHAVHGGGRVVVLDFKDRVVPAYFKDPAQTAGLYRNDVIQLQYHVKAKDGVPTHLVPRALGGQIKVLDSAVAKHGQPADFTGALVLFPKSPQVNTEVFAVLETVQGGATRQYTLANFDSPEGFKAVREKCAAAWATAPDRAHNGRNKWVHDTIRVRAKGFYNMVDPNQANIQILVKSADDLEFLTQ